MNDIWKDIPWTKKEVYVNFIALITSIVIATIMLLLKSWVLLLVYWILWILYIIVGRYVTCRHCEFHGKACPSWFMGVIGGKLYKRSERKCFPEAGLWKMFLFDVSFLAIATLLPIIVYIISFFSGRLLMIDWLFLILYSVLGLITLVLHSKLGCKKCPIDGCPLSGTKKQKK